MSNRNIRVERAGNGSADEAWHRAILLTLSTCYLNMIFDL